MNTSIQTFKTLYNTADHIDLSYYTKLTIHEFIYFLSEYYINNNYQYYPEYTHRYRHIKTIYDNVLFLYDTPILHNIKHTINGWRIIFRTIDNQYKKHTTHKYKRVLAYEIV